MIEAKFQDKLQNALRAHGVYVRSLVGNMFSPGLPDMLCLNEEYTFYIENKVWRKKNHPTCKEHVMTLLEGPQRNVIPNEFWKRRIFCPILIFRDVLVTRAWLYNNLTDTIVEDEWLKFVPFFAGLRNNADTIQN